MNHQVVCIGAMLVDELFYCQQNVVAGTSNPASVKRSPGGVMRNIVHHLVLLGIPVEFITVAGNDADGKWLIKNCKESGISMNHTMIAECSTGKYAALLNPDGSLFAAAAVNPSEDFLTIPFLQSKDEIMDKATMIVADTNLNIIVLEWLIGYCKTRNKLLIIEPVSVVKAKKLSDIDLNGLYMVTPNEDELLSLSTLRNKKDDICRELFEKGVQQVWLRKGAEGSEMISANGSQHLAAPQANVKDITGAGDAALAAWIAAYSLGMTPQQCMLAAHTMAAGVLQVEGAIDKSINQIKLVKSIKTYYPNE